LPLQRGQLAVVEYKKLTIEEPDNKVKKNSDERKPVGRNHQPEGFISE